MGEQQGEPQGGEAGFGTEEVHEPVAMCFDEPLVRDRWQGAEGVGSSPGQAFAGVTIRGLSPHIPPRRYARSRRCSVHAGFLLLLHFTRNIAHGGGRALDRFGDDCIRHHG